MPSILIIEDEKVIRSALRRLLERHGYRIAEAGAVPEAEARHTLTGFDLIISDLRLPGPPGTEVIHRAPGVPVLIMTSYASVRSAVEAMQRGAVDYIAKPFDHQEMLEAVERILARRENPSPETAPAPPESPGGIIGDCPAMRQVFDHIRKVAPTNSTVLVLGESGTGKELVARALHECSHRSQGPLIAVNCAAIPENLVESELFGHEKGAFTGAVGTRRGLVESANGGTLFLDEIGELPLPAQARLLRVLQEGEIRRVGSSHTERVDVRLVAATHRNLANRVDEGLFRGDLYYRLRVMEIILPPLRERGEDVITLARHLLDKTCRRLKRPPLTFSEGALGRIRSHPWPGNVRELENALERAAILCEGGSITPELLAMEEQEQREAAREPTATVGTPADLSLDDYFRHFVLSNEEQMTETELARRLGISRKSLWERRQRLGIPRRR